MPTTASPSPRRSASRAVRAVAVAGVAALASGGLAACGSDDGGAATAGSGAGASSAAAASSKASPAELLARAIPATQAKGSSRIAVSASFTTSGRTERFSVSGVQASKPTRLDLKAKLGGTGDVALRYVGGKAYLRMAQTPKWLSLDVAALAKSSGSPLTSPAAANDPKAIVAALQRSGDLEDEGTQRIGGTETRHVSGTLTTRAYAQQATGEARKLYDSLIAQAKTDPQVKATLDAPIDLDVYVADDDTVRRLVVAGALPSGGTEDEVRAQIDLSDYGTDVDVDAPAASETQPLTGDAIGGLVGAAG